MDLPAFLPYLNGLRRDEYTATAGRITLRVAAAGPPARCPACRLASGRLHSRHVRAVADVSWGGVPVTLRVQVRHFFCGNTACPWRIFAAPLPHLVDRYARRTCAVRTALQRIGLALGGAAGARLAALGLPVGRTTLLALIRAAPPPAGEPPRVVGIDEWAWRRGHRFGTILVDLERHQVVELLADRSAGSAASWLRQRPGIVAVVRDRSGLYADAASRGASGATQSADRWHLAQNLAEGLEEFLLHHRTALRAATAAPGEVAAATSDTARGPLTPGRPHRGRQRAAEASRQRHARPVERYAAIRRLHAAGATGGGLPAGARLRDDGARATGRGTRCVAGRVRKSHPYCGSRLWL